MQKDKNILDDFFYFYLEMIINIFFKVKKSKLQKYENFDIFKKRKVVYETILFNNDFSIGKHGHILIYRLNSCWLIWTSN